MFLGQQEYQSPKIRLGLFCIIFCVLLAGWCAVAYAENKVDEKTRINCEGKLSYDEKRGVFSFTNNVVVVKGDLRIEADNMIVLIDPETRIAKQITATGNVEVSHLQFIAYGDKLIYYSTVGKVPEYVNMPTVNGQRPIVIQQGSVTTFGNLKAILPCKDFPEGRLGGEDVRQEVNAQYIKRKPRAISADDELNLEIDQNIQQLNHSNKSEVNKAKARLFALGMAGAPKLVEALNSPFPDVRWYAEWLLVKITGKDLGPIAYADPEERLKVIEEWQQWLSSLPKPKN